MEARRHGIGLGWKEWVGMVLALLARGDEETGDVGEEAAVHALGQRNDGQPARHRLHHAQPEPLGARRMPVRTQCGVSNFILSATSFDSPERVCTTLHHRNL